MTSITAKSWGRKDSKRIPKRGTFIKKGGENMAPVRAPGGVGCVVVRRSRTPMELWLKWCLGISVAAGPERSRCDWRTKTQSAEHPIMRRETPPSARMHLKCWRPSPPTLRCVCVCVCVCVWESYLCLLKLCWQFLLQMQLSKSWYIYCVCVSICNMVFIHVA